MTRVANFAQHNLLLSNVFTAQSRASEAQLKVSTGKAAMRYDGIAPDSRRLVNLESAHIRTTRYVDNNKLVDSRLQAMETNVSAAMDLATKLRGALISALNATEDDGAEMAALAQGLFQQLGSLLNIKVDGRYLFAGTRSDTPPVDYNAAGYGAPGTTYPSTTDTGYFQGDSTKLKLRAGEGVDLAYGVTADEAPFEQLIRAFQLAGTSATGPSLDKDRANEALRVLNQAVDGLPGVVGRIGAARSTIAAANATHDEFLLYTEQSIGDIENIDLAETLTKLNADTTVIEASYAVLARLQSLSLLQFLP